MHEASQVLKDAKEGKLPNFAILTPSAGKNGTVTGSTSQHNGTSMLIGDNWINQEVSAIQKGPDGASTTIFIYYDDCGCFYDHVSPPAGMGPRLPLVIVSPYAKKGFTDHHLATNSSILAYAENVLGVAPVSEQDAGAYDFEEAFDYSQTPTPPFALHRAVVPRTSRHLPEPPPDET
jgi:phospholipase C